MMELKDSLQKDRIADAEQRAEKANATIQAHEDKERAQKWAKTNNKTTGALLGAAIGLQYGKTAASTLAGTIIGNYFGEALNDIDLGSSDDRIVSHGDYPHD